MTRTFTIIAGHGDLTQEGWVKFDDKDLFVEAFAPFTVHERAVELLKDGETPKEVETRIYSEVPDKNFQITIREERQ